MTVTTSTTDAPTIAPVVHRPRWLPPVSLLLALLGLAAAGYLTYEHFTDSKSLLCSDSGTVDCLKVTTSEWSSFLGMPVAVLGLVFFAVLTVLCLPPVWRRTPRAVDHVRLLAVLGGTVMAGYLVWAELFKIHAICLWCTVVHIITFLLLIVLAVGSILSYEEQRG